VSSTLILVVAVFLASIVEAVEALTIVLAVSLTNGWRTAALGTVLGALALAVIVVALGPALVDVVPIERLQVLIGALLLIFGLQWLRKAILRSTGRKAQHDEAAIFDKEVTLLQAQAATPSRSDIDWNGFVVSFKGVFLEGLEVAFIVLTFAANRHGSLAWSSLGAGLAVMLVGTVGIVVHRPLTRVPENTIKFAVGLMLVSFGTFWGGEGIGVDWRLGDSMILVLVGVYSLIAWAFVMYLKRGTAATPLLPRTEGAS
jgi:uncharacterized membrane protein